MSVPFAYLGVILVWSTTPLAIKWSGQDVGFLFGVASRMVIGLSVSLALVAVLRKQLPWHRDALNVYLAVGVPLYMAMSCVYWGAQFIPSGLIAVIFGLVPLITGLMAIHWLKEKSFSPSRIAGILFGLVGLATIFNNSLAIGPNAHLGILGVLGAVFFHSLGTVWVKKVGNDMPSLTANTGGLVVAVLLYSVTWLVFDGYMPTSIPTNTAASIVYLGVVGSVLGAVLFYYALKHVDTGKMSMLTLITPVTALLIGRIFNDETLDSEVMFGTAIVLSGLLVYQFGGTVMKALWGRFSKTIV